MTPALRSREGYPKLADAADRLHATTLSELFTADPDRGTELAASACGIYFDYSKNLVDADSMARLTEFARVSGLVEHRNAMFNGEHINNTEDRAVLHIALRLPSDSSLIVDGQDVVADVHAVLRRMSLFAEQVRSGEWLGHTGRPIRNVINIGIGGSDLGPVMAYEALRHYSDRSLTVRFVSNVDGTDITEATHDLDPAETLFIVASKTFGTIETMTNATTAREWCLAELEDDKAVARHFVAVSTNAARVTQFGIDPANMFGFWDWVGGRYSMDSAIGLSTMIAIGPSNFGELLSGFHDMDEHFRTAPLEQNLPVLHALLAFWYVQFFEARAMGVMPYNQYLKRFPAYLQQLTMESNGKRVRRDGSPVDYPTGAIYWGEPGTNGQHSFYQLLHQGTHFIPIDFIAFAKSLHPSGAHHDILTSNVFAQAKALAFGRTAAEVRADGTDESLVHHKVMPGNRPSTLMLCDVLTPRLLGSLIALYEHSVFTQGVLFDVDSFDQWGVELGKELATGIAPQLTDPHAILDHDSSTNELINRYRSQR